MPDTGSCGDDELRVTTLMRVAVLPTSERRPRSDRSWSSINHNEESVYTAHQGNSGILSNVHAYGRYMP